MSPEILSLSVAAAWTGFIHCLCGPDHYVPFVAMSRVGAWSLRKTLIITMICGMGHVLGSALLGFVGIAIGLIVFQLEQAEAVRGDVAAWGLFAFGAAYTFGGIIFAMRRRGGDALEVPGASPGVPLPIADENDSVGATNAVRPAGSFTPWILFVVFLFGPCEPLIPYLMVPAAKANMWGVAWVTFLFGATTLITMMTLVALIYRGTLAWQSHALQRWGHAVAGLVVMACGGAMISGF
jgi:hypothetical protein